MCLWLVWLNARNWKRYSDDPQFGRLQFPSLQVFLNKIVGNCTIIFMSLAVLPDTSVKLACIIYRSIFILHFVLLTLLTRNLCALCVHIILHYMMFTIAIKKLNILLNIHLGNSHAWIFFFLYNPFSLSAKLRVFGTPKCNPTFSDQQKNSAGSEDKIWGRSCGTATRTMRKLYFGCEALNSAWFRVVIVLGFFLNQ